MAAIMDPSMLARQFLVVQLPARYAHVEGVASRVYAATRALGVPHERLVAAAWLHDIGYAAELIATGFHPLDGARYLAQVGWDAGVVRLVAFHSGARVEAKERGLLNALLAEFDEPDADELAILTYCDMTTGPRGQPMDVDARLAEILDRYPAGDVVHRSVKAAEADLRRIVRDVEMRLRTISPSRSRSGG